MQRGHSKPESLLKLVTLLHFGAVTHLSDTPHPCGGLLLVPMIDLRYPEVLKLPYSDRETARRRKMFKRDMLLVMNVEQTRVHSMTVRERPLDHDRDVLGDTVNT